MFLTIVILANIAIFWLYVYVANKSKKDALARQEVEINKKWVAALENGWEDWLEMQRRKARWVEPDPNKRIWNL